MSKLTTALVCAIILVTLVHVNQAARQRITDAELQAGRARLKPTSCKSVGLSVTRCVNSRSSECCSRECDSSNKCKCSGLGERCASDADCCVRSVGARDIQIPCLNRICTLQE